jgi:DNA-directed RNA polymerase subunit RPC12/RpoP
MLSRLAHALSEATNLFPLVLKEPAMAITFTCSNCGKTLKAPEETVGKKARCPACQTIVIVPAAEVDAEPVHRPSEEDREPPEETPYYKEEAPADEEQTGRQGRRPCPMCGEMIAAIAAKCRFCGEIFDPELRRLETKKKKKKKTRDIDEDMTTGDWVLAILCSGIGCIMGIVWLIQGKPKAGKMIGVSILFSIIWTIVRLALEAAK